MFYAIWKLDYSIRGFITNENEVPMCWDSENEALEALKDHILFDQVEIIEI